MKSKIHFGIIGCSSVAKNSLIPGLLRTDNGHLEMIGSRSISKAKTFAKKFHCDSFGNYDEVLENKKIDAVYISLPIALQEKWIIKAAKAGKHILCEKSSTTSYISAQKIVKESKKNNVRIMEDFSFIYHPQQKKVLQLINSKKLGNVFSFNGKFGFNLKYSHENFRYKKELGGGVLNDVGCYLIRTSQFLFQEMPSSIFCTLHYDKKHKIDTRGTISMTFPHGKIALGIFGYSNSFQSTYDVWGEKSLLTVNRAFNIRRNQYGKISLISDQNLKTFQIKNHDQFQIMLNDFCNTLLSNHSHNTMFEESLLNQALIMDYARKSAKLQTSIKIKLD